MTFCYPSSDGFQILRATRVITKNNAATPAERAAVWLHMGKLARPETGGDGVFDVASESGLKISSERGLRFVARLRVLSRSMMPGHSSDQRNASFAAWDDAVTSRSPPPRPPLARESRSSPLADVESGGGESPIRRSDGVVVVVAPIGPAAPVVEVVVTEMGDVVEGEGPVAVVVLVAEMGDVVEGEVPVAVVVVLVDTVVLVTTEELVVGAVVVVVVEVVVALGSTLNTAVAQVCEPRRQAVIW